MNPFINSISDKVLSQIDGQIKKVILDSIPITFCMNPRILRSTICKKDLQILPIRSFNPSLKMHYFGFKMQQMITQKGVPISEGITSANVHDVNYLGLLNNLIQLSDYELIADKVYLSAKYQKSLFEEDKIKQITPLRRNMINRPLEQYW